MPILAARLEPTPEAVAFKGRRVVAFAGIGRPAKFFETLESVGARLVEACAFPDHHPYRKSELADLAARAERLDAMLVTTEKDRARLPADVRESVRALGVHLVFDDPAGLESLLDRVVGRRTGR